MRIRRLRLSGFKSFVDASDLVIEQGLTGVVGPNGCGKSNLLEALRWTMGENSARSMRGAAMEDVIFAGTATRPPRDFAEVSILADEVGPDAEEVEVVRRIERGAGSAYRINGRDVRAKDVALLFADAATGAHSPALVSQNRISAVISAKPAERRAMLEEAAGIAGLHVRRRDAENRLRATEANLARLAEVLADQDGRIAQLRRQARQAERYRELSERIRVAEARLIFARWRDAAAAADAARAEARDAEALVTTRTAEQAAAEAGQAAAVAALARHRGTAQAARDALSEATHRRESLVAQRGAAERRLRELEAAVARIAEDRGREGALASDAADALARLAAESKALEAEVAAADAALPGLAAALAAAEQASRDAEVALAQALARQASELADVRVARAALQAAEARLDRATRDERRIAGELAGLADAVPLHAARAAAVAAREAALAGIDRARTELSAAEAEERTQGAQRDAAQAARAAAAAELAALDGEAAALERAQRRGGRERLLDRLTVAPGYERALAAALGDDVEAGLDPADDRFWAGAEPTAADPSPPPVVAALSAQVEAPPALARRLAQVFVCEDDTGVALAVGQRLVTLEGALRRWDGYRAKAGGGAAAAERLQRANRLRALAAARPQAAAAVEAAAAELAQAEAAIRTAKARGAEARRSVDSHESAAREAARAEDRATAAIERAESQRADLAARQRRAAVDLEEAAGEAARAQATVAALPDGSATQAEVARLSAAAEAGRGAVADARAAASERERAAGAARSRIAAAAAESRGWKQRAGEAVRRIADLDRRAAEGARERDAIAGRPDALSAEIDAVTATLLGAREAVDSAQAQEQAADRALREAEATLRTVGEALAAAREARAGAAARAENQDQRRVETARLSGERFECPPPILPQRLGFDSAEVGTPDAEAAQHDRLTMERERIGPVNLVAERELAELDAARTSSDRERAELELAVNRLRGSIGILNREGRQRLLAAFHAVNAHFQRLFGTLFNGGQAHLALVDSDDPLEAGLEILAQPPGKRLQSLTLLSGGEQALTAVALIFGLFLTSPAPICVLDEVDAPLDDANIDRFCDLLERMTEETETRYLIVTHNAATMSRMHRLFGVTMVEQGVSRLVSVDLRGAETLLAAE
ncbi:chromosome segregation protein SMC [Sphingomonas sp. ac-8]|uniref:chromosome segregation protein SMC n=1 Tax=Sphingomonas sp. ac-8 TaxID=3242977 RepID=UPI003A807279